MDSDQLNQIIKDIKGGDSRACGVLLENYSPRLYGYFYRAVGNHHEAEDLLSECSLRLVRTIENYDHQGRFEPWLFRIAANLVRDRIRRIKVRPGQVSLSATDDEGNTLVADLPADNAPVEADMLSVEVSAELKQALSQLDNVTRQMILMRHFAQASFKEIAKIFDCPVGTALAKVHRGLKQLKGIIGSID